jgi:hypothetical protein
LECGATQASDWCGEVEKFAKPLIIDVNLEKRQNQKTGETATLGNEHKRSKTAYSMRFSRRFRLEKRMMLRLK